MIIFSLRYITVKDITKGTKDASLIPLFNYLTFVAGLGVFLGLVMVVTNATGHLRRDGTWYPEGTLVSILGEWATAGTFILYLYTMKSELDMTVIVLGLRRRLNTITGISVVAEGSNSTPQCPKYPQGPLQKDSSSQRCPLDPSQDPRRGR
ncbi:hypothetical protein IscW_ISCW018225 [Ixodes scapularis]|uniref:Uncharacterized protein n=1 Tax=Ixodes scapularis TaxID=6945 RepID=B7PJD4_IXOSC|nr:hypothetical protein IscW_ISCW018225 [Ixodes scapularis]|eukprot:XP_002407602.1 hypothetical protein IscW_ISCW018225 [Ixodes scapularis]